MTNEWFVEERLHIGARCSGAMERLLTLAVAWATERVQFGERIYDFQGVSFPLADSAADASAARLLTREAAVLMDAAPNAKVVHAKASLAKLFASEAAWRCADRVVQVFGGRGYMREFPAERYLRELRVDRDLGGDLARSSGSSSRGRSRSAASTRSSARRRRAPRRRAARATSPRPSTCGRCSRRARSRSSARARAHARPHGPRQPPADGQRDALLVRQPATTTRSTASGRTRRSATCPSGRTR